MRRGRPLPGNSADGSVRRVEGRLRSAARGPAAGSQRADGLGNLVQGRSAVLSVVVVMQWSTGEEPGMNTVGMHSAALPGRWQGRRWPSQQVTPPTEQRLALLYAFARLAVHNLVRCFDTANVCQTSACRPGKQTAPSSRTARRCVKAGSERRCLRHGRCGLQRAAHSAGWCATASHELFCTTPLLTIWSAAFCTNQGVPPGHDDEPGVEHTHTLGVNHRRHFIHTMR